MWSGLLPFWTLFRWGRGGSAPDQTEGQGDESRRVTPVLGRGSMLGPPPPGGQHPNHDWRGLKCERM